MDVSEERKVKLSLSLINKALGHEDVWGRGSITPLFLTSGLDRGEWLRTASIYRAEG
jgi:hypothetical protein